MDKKLHSGVLNTGPTNPVHLIISRRGAGIWTNLPSLTFDFLRRARGPASVLWVDFGLRYEMLNHFRIQPSAFPRQSSLLGLAAHLKDDGVIQRNDVVAYDQTLPAPDGPTDSVSRYNRFVLSLSQQDKHAYMVPFQVAHFGAEAVLPSLSADELDLTVSTLIETLNPTCTVLTCEGQPEAGLFSEKLADDVMLQWCLNRAQTIVCMVRHDSEQRFQDGIAIPALLSRSPDWRHRLRLILTRASSAPRIPPQFSEIVLGYLPFADFVGESVSNGRIPVIDLLGKDNPSDLSETELEYIACLGAIADRLLSRTFTIEEAS